jgi:hypothetical protein
MSKKIITIFGVFIAVMFVSFKVFKEKTSKVSKKSNESSVAQNKKTESQGNKKLVDQVAGPEKRGSPETSDGLSEETPSAFEMFKSKIPRIKALSEDIGLGKEDVINDSFPTVGLKGEELKAVMRINESKKEMIANVNRINSNFSKSRSEARSKTVKKSSE